MSKPWGGGITSWAAETELAEAEEQEQLELQRAAAAPAEPSFPTLREATASKPKKKKQVLSLSEFATRLSLAPGSRRDYEAKGLTADELMRLPTGPKERSQEELEQGRLGGGFRSYGTSYGPGSSRGGGRGFGRDRGDDNNEGSWSSGRRAFGRGFDDERRSSRVSDFEPLPPSRADEVDSWVGAKKTVLPPPERRSSDHRVGSRADEVDNWLSAKKTTAAPPTRSDRWGARRELDSDVGGRPRLVLDPPRGEVFIMEEPVRARPSPFGVARPREEVLAEKGVDWRKMETEIEVKKVGSQSGSRPGSSQSSRPGSPGADTGVRLRARVNPFGDAKPREVLLQEQGKDWRKMDFELEHRGVGRPETEEEKLLKDEINNLKKELAKEAELNFGKEASEEHMGLQELVAKKEKELELLIRELDDKVRFGQRGIERTGSAASGFGTGFDRPPSRPGTSEGSRSMDLTERPRSRGAADLWTRAGDDRRGRERGFLGSRDSDRPKSKERW